jgi:hypothetical protein
LTPEWLLSDIHETLRKKKEAEDLLRRALATEGLSRRDRSGLAEISGL